MTTTATGTSDLDDLRRAFDSSFAAPPTPSVDHLADLLTVRIAGRPYAIRVADISGLFADRPVTPVPGPLPELLGVAGFRGSIVAVYDLAALLGHGHSDKARWLVLDAGSPAMGLAFDAIDGHLRAPVGAIAVAPADRRAREDYHATSHEVVTTPDGVRPIVGIPAVRAGIETRTRQFDHSRKR